MFGLFVYYVIHWRGTSSPSEAWTIFSWYVSCLKRIQHIHLVLHEKGGIAWFCINGWRHIVGRYDIKWNNTSSNLHMYSTKRSFKFQYDHSMWQKLVIMLVH